MILVGEQITGGHEGDERIFCFFTYNSPFSLPHRSIIQSLQLICSSKSPVDTPTNADRRQWRAPRVVPSFVLIIFVNMRVKRPHQLPFVSSKGKMISLASLRETPPINNTFIHLDLGPPHLTPSAFWLQRRKTWGDLKYAFAASKCKLGTKGSRDCSGLRDFSLKSLVMARPHRFTSVTGCYMQNSL